MKNENILLVANYESNVGYAWWLMENFWVEMARYFAERGRRSFLIYPKIIESPKRLIGEPITILQHDFSNRSREALERLKSIVKENKISSIYLTDQPYYEAIYRMLRHWGVRSIVLHDHTPGERSVTPWWKKIAKKSIYLIPGLSCDLYIGVSRFVYERFVISGCVPQKRCTYVLNGIVPIEITEDNRYLIHDEFGIPRYNKVVVSTGRATYYKGIDFILRCASKLINEMKVENVFFLHCGDGPDLDAFKKIAIDLGISKRFLFAGKRSDVRELLQSCDIGIQASKGEAFSLSILEYMSAGLATVVPDHCGNNEAITNGENGMLYKPGDMDMAVRIIRELVDDNEKRKLFGKRAIDTVREKFDIRRTNKDLIECLKDKL